MKIAIDLSSIIYGTGVSVYTKNLIGTILELDRENEYILFGGSLRRFNELKFQISQYKRKSAGIRVFPIAPQIADIVWNKFHIFPVENFVGNVKIFHSSDWTQPPSKSVKITTVHDLSPLLYPDITHPKIVEVHKRRLNWVIRECDRVIVPSNTTANDLEKIGYPYEKIRIIPEAPDPNFKIVSKSKIDQVKNKFNVSGKYLLSIGVNSRKNTQMIINAINNVRKKVNICLVVVGHSQFKMLDIDGVTFTGHVSDSELSALYSGAEALVYPSLYEGFGLPILEAFKCKIPVITSNIGSMKEVAGSGAVLVEPENLSSVTDGIFEALNNKDEYIKKGLKETLKYSWELVAQKTLGVYKEFS